MRSVLKIFGLVFLTVLIVFHLYLHYYGIANFFTTLLYFFGVFFLLDAILLKVRKLSWKSNPFRFSLFVIVCLLVMVEGVLRYYVKDHSSYAEQAGSWFYVSPYRAIQLENNMKMAFFGKEDAGLQLHKANDTIYDNKPEFNYAHYINEIGIRSKKLSQRNAKAEKVILGLGDSFVQGIGAPEDSTWFRQLEKLFQRDSINVEVVSGGISGSDVFYEWYKLKHLLYETYQPDEVLVFVNPSDIFDVMTRGGMDRFVSENKVVYKKAPWWEFFYSFSFISRHIAHKLFNINEYYMTDEQTQKTEKEAEQLICNCLLNEFSEYCRMKNLDWKVVFTPNLDNLQNGTFNYAGCKDQLLHSGIDVIDLVEEMRDLDRPEDYFWLMDQHNNSKGQRVWADKLFVYLRDNNSTDSVDVAVSP